MIEINKIHWPNLGLDCTEIVITEPLKHRPYIKDQLYAEDQGWA